MKSNRGRRVEEKLRKGIAVLFMATGILVIVGLVVLTIFEDTPAASLSIGGLAGAVFIVLGNLMWRGKIWN